MPFGAKEVQEVILDPFFDRMRMRITIQSASPKIFKNYKWTRLVQIGLIS